MFKPGYAGHCTFHVQRLTALPLTPPVQGRDMRTTFGLDGFRFLIPGGIAADDRRAERRQR
jgi:hypothetical protein